MCCWCVRVCATHTPTVLRTRCPCSCSPQSINAFNKIKSITLREFCVEQQQPSQTDPLYTLHLPLYTLQLPLYTLLYAAANIAHYYVIVFIVIYFINELGGADSGTISRVARPTCSPQRLSIRYADVC